MGKTLRVIKPFYVMEIGDTFELLPDGKRYSSNYSEEHNEGDDANNIVSSSYTSTYTISAEYAKSLIDAGYLEDAEVANKPTTSSTTGFVNVFDEITNMLNMYKDDLKNIDEDMANSPSCLKVERQTVLQNLIKALEHLNSLKK